MNALGLTTGILPGIDEPDRVREGRLRRAAQRQGLTLAKSRRRDAHATDYGTYMLLDLFTSGVVVSGRPSGYGLTLEQVEDELTRRR